MNPLATFAFTFLLFFLPVLPLTHWRLYESSARRIKSWPWEDWKNNPETFFRALSGALRFVFGFLAAAIALHAAIGLRGHEWIFGVAACLGITAAILFFRWRRNS